MIHVTPQKPPANLTRGAFGCYTYSMTNTAAPAVGSLVALRVSHRDAIGRVVRVEDVRGDGSLVRVTLDTEQPATGRPFQFFTSAVVVVAE